jgi:hypothetical protein
MLGPRWVYTARVSSHLLHRSHRHQNVHQAGFVATRLQLEAATASGCLTIAYWPHWAYHQIEAADTQLYFQCGLMKVMPLEVTPAALGLAPHTVALV